MIRVVLLIAMTATADTCTWIATQKEFYRRQHSLLEELEARSSDWSVCSVGTKPAEPKWLGYFVPRETFRRVSFLQFVGEIRARNVECVASLSSVEELQFFMSPVTDGDLAPFKHSQMRVKILGLGDTRVTDKGAECFAGIRGLTTLDLGCSEVKGECLRVFQHSRLEKLCLTNTRVDDKSLRWLEGFTHLRLLVLDGTRVTGRGLTHIATLKALGELDLSNTKVDDASLSTIANMPSLTRLHLNGTAVTDAGLSIIANMPSLTRLYLNGTAVTDAGLAKLQGLQHLETLSLDRTPVGDAGLEHLKKFNNLKVLLLRSTQVTDAGLEHLKELSSLQRLCVSKTQIGDAGLDNLKGLANLEALYVLGTRVTDEGVERLQQTLRNCKILR